MESDSELLLGGVKSRELFGFDDWESVALSIDESDWSDSVAMATELGIESAFSQISRSLSTTLSLIVLATDLVRPRPHLLPSFP
jgi:hypothetical protein